MPLLQGTVAVILCILVLLHRVIVSGVVALDLGYSKLCSLGFLKFRFYHIRTYVSGKHTWNLVLES